MLNFILNAVASSSGSTMAVMIIIGIILIGIGIVLIFLRAGKLNTVNEMKYVQTSQIGNIIENHKSISGELGKGGYSEYVELKGNGKCSKPLKSQHTNTPCLWFRSTVVREYEEERTVTDSNGNRRTEIHRGSETVSTTEDSTPFDLDDGTGSIKINPQGAEIIGKQVYNQFKPGEYSGPLNIVLSTFNKRRTIGYRFTEDLIPVDQKLYILGEASDKDGELEVKRPSDKKKKFLVSVKSEEELIKSFTSAALFMLIGTIVLSLIGVGLIIGAFFVK
jgi:uncharacterized membrane protein